MDFGSLEIFHRILLYSVKDIPASISASYPHVIIDEYLAQGEKEELSRLHHSVKATRRNLLSCLLVCKRWNLVCVDLSDLWTTVYVTRLTMEENVERAMKMSGTALLDVILDFTDANDMARDDWSPPTPRRPTPYLTTVDSIAHEDSDLSHEEFAHLTPGVILHTMTAIQKEISRFRSLSITVVNVSDMIYIARELSIIENVPSSLQQFRFVYIGPVLPIHNRPLPSAFFGRSVPSLRRLRLHGVPLSTTQSAITMHLTTLAIRSSTGSNVAWDSFMTVLRMSPQLRMLTLYNIQCDDIPAVVHGNGRLTSLVFLFLGRLGMDLAVSILDTLDLHSLPELTLDFDGTDSTILCRRLISNTPGRLALIETVQRLAWTGLFAPDDVLYCVIKKLQALEFLDLRNAWYLFNMLERMTLDYLGMLMRAQVQGFPLHELPPIFCPRLDVLVASGPKGLALGSFLVARNVMGCRLSRVSINIHDVKELELFIIRSFVRDVQLFHDV